VKNTKSDLHTINNVLNQSQESVLLSIREEKGEKHPIVNRANTGEGVGPLNDYIIADRLGESAKGRQRQR